MSHLCRTFVCLLSYFLIYGIMAYLCALTPFVCDDFGYWPYSDAQMSFRFGLDHFWRFHTIHWQTVNGRTIAHLIVQFGILWKPLLHVFLTPLIFCLMLFLGQYLIWGDSRRIFANFISPLFLFCCIWLFTPVFGIDYLWRTGAGNYLYTTALIFLFLCPCRKWLAAPAWRPNPFLIPFWLFLGLCAGWTNENFGILAAAGPLEHLDFNFIHSHTIRTSLSHRLD